MVVSRQPFAINKDGPQRLAAKKHVHAIFMTVADVVFLKVILSELNAFPSRLIVTHTEQSTNLLATFTPWFCGAPLWTYRVEPRWWNRECHQLFLKAGRCILRGVR